MSLSIDVEYELPMENQSVMVLEPLVAGGGRYLYPEQGKLQGLFVQGHHLLDGEFRGGSGWQFYNDINLEAIADANDGEVAGDIPYDYVPDQVVAGFDVLNNTGLPIVGWHLFDYGWRVVAADGVRRMQDEDLEAPPYDFSDVIPRTVDLNLAIVRTAQIALEFDPSLPPLRQGAFKRDVIFEHNDVSVVPTNDVWPASPLAALWFYMVVGRQITVDGITHEIPDSVFEMLTGKTPRFDEASKWGDAIRKNGWTRGGRLTRYHAFAKDLADVYDPYFPQSEPVK